MATRKTWKKKFLLYAVFNSLLDVVLKVRLVRTVERKQGMTSDIHVQFFDSIRGRDLVMEIIHGSLPPLSYVVTLRTCCSHMVERNEFIFIIQHDEGCETPLVLSTKLTLEWIYDFVLSL